jgi:hypothetical protein
VGQVYSANQASDTTLTTTAETVVATLTGVASQRAGQQVRLHGQVNISTGTATTVVTLRIREDSLTGTLVDELQADGIAAAVGAGEDHEIVATHTPTGELSGKTYVLTVAQTAATGNGTVNHASLEAETLP